MGVCRVHRGKYLTGNMRSSRRGTFLFHLKVPKCEIFDRSNFPDFYTIKSSWVGDLVVKNINLLF
jgi:hypothetical protein